VSAYSFDYSWVDIICVGYRFGVSPDKIEEIFVDNSLLDKNTLKPSQKAISDNFAMLVKKYDAELSYEDRYEEGVWNLKKVSPLILKKYKYVNKLEFLKLFIFKNIEEIEEENEQDPDEWVFKYISVIPNRIKNRAFIKGVGFLQKGDIFVKGKYGSWECSNCHGISMGTVDFHENFDYAISEMCKSKTICKRCLTKLEDDFIFKLEKDDIPLHINSKWFSETNRKKYINRFSNI
jgi:hypothetical protein